MIEKWLNSICFSKGEPSTDISDRGPIYLWRGKHALSPSPASFRHSGLRPQFPKTTLPLLGQTGAWSSVVSLGGLRVSASPMKPKEGFYTDAEKT